jgi:hypothetical protein
MVTVRSLIQDFTITYDEPINRPKILSLHSDFAIYPIDTNHTYYYLIIMAKSVVSSLVLLGKFQLSK